MAISNEDSTVSEMEKGNYVVDQELNVSTNPTVDFMQRLLAEFLGTYITIFVGCGSVVVNKLYGGTVTFPGICLTWGLIVMITIYTFGHVSAHFNPAVTITFTTLGLFPVKEVFPYVVVQTLASLMASGTLVLLIDIPPEKGFFGTAPAGSLTQALIVEIIVGFALMVIISGSGNDRRARKEFSGFIIGMTITANILCAGQISGASMNPARSLGPAIVLNDYKAIWVYMVGPIVGTIIGGFTYNLLTPTSKSFNELLFEKS